MTSVKKDLDTLEIDSEQKNLEKSKNKSQKQTQLLFVIPLKNNKLSHTVSSASYYYPHQVMSSETSTILPYSDNVTALLRQLESEYSKHDIRFIFVTSFGSHLTRTSNENSNLNLRGFYVASQKSYLSVQRPPKEIKLAKEKKEQSKNSDEKKEQVEEEHKSNKEHITKDILPTDEKPAETLTTSINIEYEFWDVKRILGEASKPDKQTEEWTMWLRSDCVYVNQLDSLIMNELVAASSFPLAALVGRLIQSSKTMPKMSTLRSKDFVFCLIAIIQVFYHTLHFPEKKQVFPDPNIWKTLELTEEQFPEKKSTVDVLRQLLTKWLKLKASGIEESEKSNEEQAAVTLMVELVEKYKPLQKKQYEALFPHLKPMIVIDKANEMFRSIFSKHVEYKSFCDIKE